MTIDLSDEDRIKVLNSDSLFGIMQRILLREELIDQDREHCWVVSLATSNLILNIERIAIGTINKVLVDPMEVYSVALQKRSAKIILVHNHPSGQVQPSEEDKDITDRIYQVGQILNTPLFDHLIISSKFYYSFRDTGLLEEVSQSTKYVPQFILKERFLKQGAKIGFEEVARKMKEQGYDLKDISELTGLSVSAIKKIKIK